MKIGIKRGKTLHLKMSMMLNYWRWRSWTSNSLLFSKKHNMKNIAVVEKGWIGGGNTGRNTTIIRSNLFMGCKCRFV